MNVSPNYAFRLTAKRVLPELTTAIPGQTPNPCCAIPGQAPNPSCAIPGLRHSWTDTKPVLRHSWTDTKSVQPNRQYKNPPPFLDKPVQPNRQYKNLDWTTKSRQATQIWPTGLVRKLLHASPTGPATLDYMGYARSHLVDPHAPGVYHCVSRCVRRAFLCGVDPLTVRTYQHRRGQIEQRIHLLAGCFALSVHAYAVMSNHLHLVIYTDPAAANRWTDDEVTERWRTTLTVYKHESKPPAATGNPTALNVSAEWIADKRLRLASLRLVHEAAQRGTSPDVPTPKTAAPGTSGSHASARRPCSTRRAITAAMAYVDLNPIRAGIAQSLQTSEYTSIALRLRESAGADAAPASSEPREATTKPQRSTDRLKPMCRSAASPTPHYQHRAVHRNWSLGARPSRVQASIISKAPPPR